MSTTAAAMSNEQLEFDIGSDEKATNVTVESPVEEKEQEKAAPVASTSATQAERDELDSVSENVQKRIAKLTARMRESERREQAALEYARGLQSQAQVLQQRLVQTDYSRLNEAKTRLETQQATLKAIIKKAREEGDIDTETEAQHRLTELVHENRQVADWLQSQQANMQQAAQTQQVAQPVYQPQPAAAPPRAAPSPKAEEWAANNPWFGQDREMTYAAWGVHQTLIENEGFDPNSDEYYTELDRRIRSRFSDRFQDQPRQQRSAPAVAPASRSSGINSARRTVRLSPSQVAIAKKLGVPLEEYAKYVKE